jgi:hypothetical protein
MCKPGAWCLENARRLKRNLSADFAEKRRYFLEFSSMTTCFQAEERSAQSFLVWNRIDVVCMDGQVERHCDERCLRRSNPGVRRREIASQSTLAMTFRMES